MDVPTQEMPLDTWQSLIDLNLTSTFVCTKLLGGAMVARGAGGRVINVASISGMIANRGIGGRSYETAKAAVIGFTRATAADWAPVPGDRQRHRARGLHDRAQPALADAEPGNHRDVQGAGPDGRVRRAGRPRARSPSTSPATPRAT